MNKAGNNKFVKKRIGKIILAVFCMCMSLAVFAGCGEPKDEGPLGNGWQPESSMKLEYADRFAVDYYKDGYKLMTVEDGRRYLMVPEGKDVPEGIDADINIINMPIENTYLAATSAMCMFDEMDRLDAIKLSGTRADGWYIENAAKAMNDGEIEFAGKYSEPDYELLLSKGTKLAIENTMINHAPEAKEKLEELGITVFVDNSSGEKEALGRSEWIKAYGAMLDEEELAEKLFSEQAEYIRNLEGVESTGRTVACFRITPEDKVNAYTSDSYVAEMIDTAGGEYVFSDIGDPESKKSTVVIEMETFFEKAKDADIIIYNSTIGDEIYTVNDLIELNGIMKEMKAVKEGNVWCLQKNMFQDSMNIGTITDEFHKIFTGDADKTENLKFFHKVK